VNALEPAVDKDGHA